MNKNLDDCVSVVIPVYNSAQFLRRSIDSLLAQTWKNLEVIAIDDGSTDGSYDILKEYENIRVIRQENHGLADVLNRGIREIHGRWFKWFSPDDVLVPEAIEELMMFASGSENTIVYSNWILIDKKDNMIRYFSESNYNHLDNFDYNIRLLDGQLINVNSALIPVSLFEKGCTFRKVKDMVAIDYDFFLRAGILYRTHFQLVTKYLLKYRIHEDQMSHKNISKTLDYLPQLRQEILSFLDEEERKRYRDGIDLFNKEKPLNKKTLDLGLKIATNILPDSLVDKLLLFYLNQVRRTR